MHNKKTTKIINYSSKFIELRNALAPTWPSHARIPIEKFEPLAQEFKEEAVRTRDEPTANAIWCLEMIRSAQDYFLQAFVEGKNDRFYDSWCAFATCESYLSALSRHYNVYNKRFGLQHMVKHVPKFQKLFPYRFFSSIGFVIEEANCSICESEMSLDSNCNHIKGELYEGQICSRIISKARLLEVSVVQDPIDKRNVLFLDNTPYNYGIMKYTLMGLETPWDEWDVIITEPSNNSQLEIDSRSVSISERFRKVPSWSRKDYQGPSSHYKIILAKQPTAPLPRYVADCYYEVENDGPENKPLLSRQQSKDGSM